MEKMDLKSMYLLNKSNFWNGKRVLLTGHTGFKGSWLSLWLQSLGSVIRGVALEPQTEPALFKVAQVENGMEHRIADVRDLCVITKQVEEFQPEIIFHLAAQPLVRHSYKVPVETYSTNVMGTVNLLEAARHSGSVKAIVNITTDKCYENREWVWGYREDEPMGGHDPYSSSKGCAELVTSAYRKSFLRDAGIAVATARAGNVIGGGDWAVDRLIPDILHAIENGESVLIRNPSAIRPWQHVLEPLSGYLLLAESLYQDGQTNAEGWNFGPNDKDARPVKWIVEYLCNYWGRNTSWTLQPGSHPHESNFLKLDISKSHRRLGWTPHWPLEAALKYIAEWHKSWLGGKDMRAVCLAQIEKFQSGL